MSYQTVEVDLENGVVRPRGEENLPPKAHALLTIMAAEERSLAMNGGESLADRVRHLAGIGSGRFTDLSVNKTHLADFGR